MRNGFGIAGRIFPLSEALEVFISQNQRVVGAYCRASGGGGAKERQKSRGRHQAGGAAHFGERNLPDDFGSHSQDAVQILHCRRQATRKRHQVQMGSNI